MNTAAAALLLLAGAGPSLDPSRAMSCRVESAHNQGTGEPVAIPAAIHHPAGSLKIEGGFLIREEDVEDAHGRVETAHRINRQTRRFEATSYRTDHAAGEEHLIRTTGNCRPG